jgi:hypothetical protein
MWPKPIFDKINTYIIYTSGKSDTKIWATFVFFQKLSKVNNRPLGENSPNLVTLSMVHPLEMAMHHREAIWGSSGGGQRISSPFVLVMKRKNLREVSAPMLGREPRKDRSSAAEDGGLTTQFWLRKFSAS